MRCETTVDMFIVGCLCWVTWCYERNAVYHLLPSLLHGCSSRDLVSIAPALQYYSQISCIVFVAFTYRYICFYFTLLALNLTPVVLASFNFSALVSISLKLTISYIFYGSADGFANLGVQFAEWGVKFAGWGWRWRSCAIGAVGWAVFHSGRRCVGGIAWRGQRWAWCLI